MPERDAAPRELLNRDVLEGAMRRAIDLARRGPVDDENPRVGCVLLAPNGDVVAEGWHLGAGTPHAEIVALETLPTAWRGRSRELTAVVTLEPCNHFGRTGPCAAALAEAELGAVVYSLPDPGADSAGGADTLRRAGVRVLGGVLEAEGRELLRPWLERQAADRGARHQRPFVTVKWAQTLDGRAAAADGSSQWITGPEARSDVHRRRAQADAILVGTGTLYADDPALTARTPDGALLVPWNEQPVPVVLGHRRIPKGARVLSHPALQDPNGITTPILLTGDDLAADVRTLRRAGVNRLFVEGGPTVASAFLRAGLVDEVLVYIAPALLGGPRLAIGDLGIESMSGITRLRVSQTLALGDDLLYIAAPVRATAGSELGERSGPTQDWADARQRDNHHVS